MKKILYLLIALVATGIATTNISAQDSNSYQMASAPQDGSYKFVIEGNVALDIPDSCYNIYITDIDGNITDKDLVACVKVKNKKFRYETNIDVIKQGRIRAIMPGDNLGSAWINLYFIPGFTIYMTVHDGYYDLQNRDQYNFMVSAWQNEVPVSALLARLGMDSSYNDQSNATTQMSFALASYRNLISDYKQQINNIQNMAITYDEESKAIQKLLNRIEQINAKMEQIVDSYTNNMTF